jgi:hypothetical protein
MTAEDGEGDLRLRSVGTPLIGPTARLVVRTPAEQASSGGVLSRTNETPPPIPAEGTHHVPLLLLIPLLLVLGVVAAIAVIALRNGLGEDAPSWLRGTALVVVLGFVFFVLAGLGVVALIFAAFTAGNPILLGASAVLFLLAVGVPVIVWLAYRPGLRRLQAEEAVRREAAYAEWQRQQQAFREQQAQFAAQARARVAAERAMNGSRVRPSRDPAPSGDDHGGPIYYEILGLDVDATESEIEQAYKREIRVHHPDRGGEQRRAQLINEAFETLRDPAKRARYDRESGVR